MYSKQHNIQNTQTNVTLKQHSVTRLEKHGRDTWCLHQICFHHICVIRPQQQAGHVLGWIKVNVQAKI